MEPAQAERPGVGLQRALPDQGVLHHPDVRGAVQGDEAERQEPADVVDHDDGPRGSDRVPVDVRCLVEHEAVRAVEGDEVRLVVGVAAEAVGEVWHRVSVPGATGTAVSIAPGVPSVSHITCEYATGSPPTRSPHGTLPLPHHRSGLRHRHRIPRRRPADARHSPTAAPAASTRDRDPAARSATPHIPEFDGHRRSTRRSTRPEFLQDWSTPYGSRVLAGYAGGDDIWLVDRRHGLDRTTGGACVLPHRPGPTEGRRPRGGPHPHRRRRHPDPERAHPDAPRHHRRRPAARRTHFEPGVTPFAGSATAGATIVANDTGSGDELFTTKASSTRYGTGTWSADAELTRRRAT